MANIPNRSTRSRNQFMEKFRMTSCGQPLHYRRANAGQFVLYSVGWNERDDGGVVGQPESRDSRDEVATPGYSKTTGSGGIRRNKFQHPTSNILRVAQASRLSFRASRPKPSAGGRSLHIVRQTAIFLTPRNPARRRNLTGATAVPPTARVAASSF